MLLVTAPPVTMLSITIVKFVMKDSTLTPLISATSVKSPIVKLAQKELALSAKLVINLFLMEVLACSTIVKAI